jgi:hypothetical protein
MEGRGYGITIFLALLITFSAIQFLNNSRWVWGGVFIGSGFAMTMALPSSLFFLFGLPVFMLIVRYFELWKNNFSIKKLVLFCLPFLIMFVFIGTYFLIIYEGLKYGKEIQPLALDGKRIMELTELLVAPWGFYIYIFFAVGASKLKGTRERVIFISIFFVPMILTLATGVVGYARIYIYWLPFILFISAYGMVEVISFLKKNTGNLVHGFGAGIIFLLAFSPTKQIIKYYEARENGSLVVAGPNPTLSEATKIAGWVDKNIPQNNLIVVSVGGPESSALIPHHEKNRSFAPELFYSYSESKRLILDLQHLRQ